MLELIQKGNALLQLVLPILLFIFSSMMTWRLIKHAKDMGKAWAEFTKNPISLIFALFVIGLTLFIYFKYIHPLLSRIG